MNDVSNGERSIDLLQQLGLKEYEAKSFVALTRLSKATAKQISEISDVPRTRVYDAVRVLESKGLVEIQHSNPQQFRAVSIEEAAETLRSEYESRAESLRETLQGIEPAEQEEEVDVTHEVWALTGTAATANRAKQLIDQADQEVVLVVGHESVLTDTLKEGLTAATDRGVSVVVGVATEAEQEEIAAALPEVEVFVSGLDWLSGMGADDTEISRLLLTDRNSILVSTVREATDDRTLDEHAVFGRGFDNGLVAIARRLMATGLLPSADPADGGAPTD